MEISAPRRKFAPDFIRWSFGGAEYSSYPESQNSDFKISFAPSIPRLSYDLREQIINRLLAIDRERNGKTVALCYSGGLDSEILGCLLYEMGIPFEIYFLDIWGINADIYNQHSPAFLKKCPVMSNRVTLNKLDFYESISLNVFREFGVEFPTYIAMTHLFENIPADQFILVADGELNRRGSLIQRIGAEISRNLGTKLLLPTTQSSIFYYLWANARDRSGEFYFFQSTPELIAAMFQHPDFEVSYPFSSTRKVFSKVFPEIVNRPPSSNWDGKAYVENQFIRAWLQKNFARDEVFKNWKPGMGAPLIVDEIFSDLNQ